MTTRDQALDSWKHHVATSALCDPAAMNLRIARFGEIPASPRAFVDTWVEGHQRTRMSVIGSGVTENAPLPRCAA